MRLILSLLTLGSFAFGAWWMWDHFPGVRQFVEQKIEGQEFQTLEVRYSAEHILENNQSSLVRGSGYTILQPELAFYPYLMMEVKFSSDEQHTEEGLILWGLTDGEMVIDAESWERTHGFEDCLVASVNRTDFNILRELIQHGGRLSRDRLYSKFRVDSEVVDSWIESCRKKKLIVSTGNQYRLHFERPNLSLRPQTRLNEWLVAQPARHTTRAKRRYSPGQVKRLAELAFGQDFAVRSMEEVFLPVYRIAVQNPDGSVLTTYWNALNGKQIKP